MTPSELKANILSRKPDSHFFDLKTMRCFGDSMRNYGVKSAVILANFDEAGNYVEEGISTEVWELYRKQAVKHGLKSPHYFRKSNFEQVFEKKA